MADELKIKTSLDASGVQPGVDKTVDGIKQVEKATTEAASTAKKEAEGVDGSVLTNRRSVRHLLDGMRELQAGGIEALGGLATEGFLATEAFEGMLGPLAPILMGLTLITSIAIPMVAKWQEHKDKIDESKKSIEGVTQAVDDAAKAEATSLKTVEDEQRQIDANFKRMEESNSKALGHITKMIELQKNFTDEVLRGQEAAELAKARTPLEQEEIKARYNDARGRTDASANEQKYIVDMAANYADQSRISRQENQKSAALKAQQDQYAKETSDATQALADAKAAGIEPDRDGKYGDSLNKAQNDLKTLKDNYQTNLGAQYDVENPEDQEKGIAALDQQIKDAENLVDVATRASSAEAGEKNRESLKTSIEKTQGEVDNLHQAFTDLAAKHDELFEAHRTETLKSQNDATERGANNKEKVQEIEDRDFSGEQKAKTDAQQIIADDKSKSSAQRADALRQIGEIAAQEAERKIKEGTAPGVEKPLTQGEIDALREGAAKSRNDGNFKANELTTKETNASDRKQIDQISGAIEASGNKESIAKLRQIVEKDKGDLTKELADLLAAHISTQTQINIQTKASLDNVKEKMLRHSKSLGNPGGN